MTYDDWLEVENHLFEVPRKFYGQSLVSLQQRHAALTGEDFTSWYHASLMNEYRHAKGEIDALEAAIEQLRQMLGTIMVGPSKVTMGHLRMRHIPESLRKKYSITPAAQDMWDSTETPIPNNVLETMDKYLGMTVLLG